MNNKQVEEILFRKVPVTADEGQIRRTVALAKAELSQRKPFASISFLSFSIRQIGFCGWKIWLMQASILLVLCLGMDLGHCYNTGALTYSAPFMLRVCAIITLLTALPILYRSSRYHMLEVEVSARAGYARLLLSRLALVGIGDVLMLAVIFAFALLKTDIGLYNALFCLLLPFLAMLTGLLLLLPRVPLRVLPYALYGLGVAMLMGAAALGTKTPDPALYPLWGAVCLLSLTFCFTQLNILKQQAGFADVQFS